jgi:FAD/FMN-containing dehydrogenase
MYLPRNDFLSWGRVARTQQRVAFPRFRKDLNELVNRPPGESVLAVGLRRSYGDSVLNSEGGLIATVGLDRFIALDPDARVLRAEAGVTLGEIMRLIVPRGLFVPVTPGTRFVTLGGAVANDVHGKNHHQAGTFGRHVGRLGLLRSDGSRVEIGPKSRRDLFEATVGGLGLTGLIEWVEINLQPIPSSQLQVEIVPYEGLTEFWQLADDSIATHEHTVAWIDCHAMGPRSGRGIFSRANWSPQGGLRAHVDRQVISLPVDAPESLLNSQTVGLFNRLYYAVQKRKAGISQQHYASFFHPLDSIGNWNRLYGPRGLWQYQCVVPFATMKDAIAALLAEIARSGQGSFLAVLKTCGDIRSPGLLSFPLAGATLALDFSNRSDSTQALFARLDAIVLEAKGRLYAAKDGRIPKQMWRDGYPNLDRFTMYLDPAFKSDFWRRVAP